MNRLKPFELLFFYLRDRLKIIVAFIIFILIYILVYRLYYLSMFPVIYATIIMTFISCVYAIYDFYRYSKRHRELYGVYKSIDNTLNPMPDAKGLIEIDYQAIISSLFEDRRNVISRADIKQSDMREYFTLWVHQIKTPISAMKLLLQNDSNENNLSAIEQELFKIEQYVEMVLTYLRVGDMSSDLILKEYNLYKLVKRAVKKYSVVFINKKIPLKFEEFDCNVVTDEKWLSFVLEQLLSNALKYTKTGYISIYLSDTNSKTLVIEDTGAGIHEEDLPRLFTRGFTGYNGRMNRKSTGIGLYLSKKIMDKLAHKIYIKSEVGKGTMVYLDMNCSNNQTFL